MKKIYSILVVACVLALSASSVMAAEFAFPEKGGGSITINEEKENLYTAGNVVSINSYIWKGLYAAGSVVNLNADVEGRATLAGGTIIARSNVGGSMHVAGGNISIEGAIVNDLFIGGGDVVLTESSSVGGDLIVGAGTLTINGPVTGNILLAGGKVIVNSRVGGNANIKTKEIELGDNAVIVGSLEYTSPEKIEIDGGKVLGGVVFNQSKASKMSIFKNPKLIFSLLIVGLIIKFLSAIAVGLVFVYLLKKFTKGIVKESLRKFWVNLGLGLAVLVLVPVISIILAISVLGLWLAGLIMVLYLLLLLLASVFASIILGTWLIKTVGKKKDYTVDWKAVVIGIIALKLIIFIPLVGWLIKLVLLLIALGVLIQWLRKTLL